jgi:hypothetical protein
VVRGQRTATLRTGNSAIADFRIACPAQYYAGSARRFCCDYPAGLRRLESLRVISYLVAQRSSEFGVRMALGANRFQIANLVLSRGATIAVAGCLGGLVLSAFASRLLITSLYRTDWYDPLMLCLVPLLLLAVVLLASWLPARRAAAIDPMQALRNE